MKLKTYFRRTVALPSEHGAWVFLLSPLLIGTFAAGQIPSAWIWLVVALLAAFLLRHPTTILVKAYSGRRPRSDLPAARFWMSIYSLIGLLAVFGLLAQGFGYLLLLALPGIPVFIWHLVLISKRAERRKPGVEIIGSGVLALSAPAAYWLGIGQADSTGWWLFGLCWLQSAASIVYAYLRLEQRELKEMPALGGRIAMARRALFYTTFNVLAVLILSILSVLPPLLFIPYLLQWAETLWGTVHPAIGVKPTRIGLRQLIVSSLFTVLFILTWAT